MPLKIVYPSSGKTVPPNFTATGTYDHADSLIAMLVSLDSKPYLGKVHPVPKVPGTWYCHFYGIADGNFILAVGDLLQLAAAVPVAFRVKSKKKSAKKKATAKKKVPFAGFPPPSQPTANTDFQVSDPAYGIAPNCTPAFNASFTDSNQQQFLGLPLPNDPGAPAGYWSFCFSGLANAVNPTHFDINDSALPANSDDERPVTIIANSRPKRGKKKKSGKKKSLKK